MTDPNYSQLSPIDRQRHNNMLIQSVLQEHIASHLSDVYKIERFDIVRSPIAPKVPKGQPKNQKSWMITVEAVNSRNNNIVATFNFLFTQKQVYDILTNRHIEIDND